MMKTAEDVTDTLRRTRQRMAQELARQEETLAAMAASNETLGKANEEFASQHPLLRKARKLLGVIQQQEVMDRVMLWLGVAIFGLAVLYILHRRIPMFRSRSSGQVRGTGGLRQRATSRTT